jgi:hypothetical protein
MENAAVQRLQSRIKQTKIDNAILILIQSLNEEKSMVDWIKQIPRIFLHNYGLNLSLLLLR